MNVEHSSARLLEHFRATKRRLPLHPLEKAVLAAVAIHLCFLPWALGTMHVWSQVTSLALSAVGMALALIPRTYSGDLAVPVTGIQFPVSGSHSTAEDSRSLHTDNRPPPTGSSLSTAHRPPSTVSPPPSTVHRPPPTVSSLPPTAFRLNPWPRLLRFPIFWIGLALLGYIALQASNPSWVWTRNATSWWLVRVNDIPWLPTSIDAPFARSNAWRQLIIYASAWLTVCTIWTGFTRRRSLQILLTVLIGNAVLLAILGFVQRITGTSAILWNFEFPGGSPFSTLIYKNHAGAFFALLASLTVAAAIWIRDTGERSLKKSTPASLLIFASMLMAAGVLASASRGAVITLTLFWVATAIWFFIRRSQLPGRTGSNPVITTLIVLSFLGVVVGTLRYVDFSAIKDRFTVLSKDPEATFEGRRQAYAAGSEMLADNWQRGTGAGGFRHLFPEYIKKHPAIHEGGRLFWDHLHRDWVELPIELGAAGCGLLALGAAYWLAFFFRARAAWHSLAVPLLLGCSQTLAHAWFDFPFQNPAILCTWLALMAVSARWLELDSA